MHLLILIEKYFPMKLEILKLLNLRNTSACSNDSFISLVNENVLP